MFLITTKPVKLQVLWAFFIGAASLLVFPSPLMAKDFSQAFKIDERTTTYEQAYESDQGNFFKLEKQKYELLERLAKDRYLEYFWHEMASKNNKGEEQVRSEYIAKQIIIDNVEVQKFIDKYKEHPKLKDLNEKEKNRYAIEYLTTKKTDELVERILDDAIRSKRLVILYPRPDEPVFNIKISEIDQIKYGPNPSDTQPMGCSSDCTITVVEYSEYQCPFCSRVMPVALKLMKEYKGRVRWIVRDFPLGFHNRARPAAIAAKCASEQGKYWEMYETLFSNQRSLSDGDLKSFGKLVGLNQNQYEECLNSPQKSLVQIEENYRSGEKLGVTGTPSYFVNGRKIDGAVPYENFKDIFEEELSKNKSK